MLIEEAIYKLLKTHTALTNIVVGRIFSGVAKQDARAPYVVYRAPEDSRRQITRTLEGGCTLVEQPIKVFCAASTYGEAATLDSIIGVLLDEFRGTVIDDTTSPEESIDIQGIFTSDDAAHEYSYSDKTKLHEFLTEFDCHFIDPLRITES